MTALPSDPVFIRQSPAATARRYAPEDVHGRATPGQVTWLRGHPVEWLDALTEILVETQDRMAESVRYVKAMAPRQGETATPEYLEAKRAHDERHGRRITFLRHVTERRNEAAALVADQGPSRAQLVTGMARAVELLARDDADAAYRLLRSILRRVGGDE